MPRAVPQDRGAHTKRQIILGVCVWGGPSLVVGGQDAELVLAGRCCAKGLTATRDFQDAFSRLEEQKVGGGAG